MARQVADRKLTLTSSVRGSLVAKVVQLAQKKGVSVSEVVDGILSEYFERADRPRGDGDRIGSRPTRSVIL
jgi:hypothetical protein